MTLLQPKSDYTIKDIYELPERERAELINGRMYMMAPPSRKHQEILNYLNTEINLYIRMKEGNCKIYPAPFAVFLNADDFNYVEPDISIICDRDKLTDRGCDGAPDWIIEIVSSGSQRMDYMIKLFKYRTAGVKEYWIVDPSKERISVYNFAKEDMNEFTFRDMVASGIYPDLKIDFAKIESE